MDVGADAASGALLLFLHADTLLPDGWPEMVREAMADPLVTIGAFRFRLDRSGPFQRWAERAVDWRVRLFKLPYGDQALFVKASVFRELGGYAGMPLMEDVDLVRRLKRYGRLSYLEAPVTTSARRWEKNGPLRTTLTNTVLLLGYHLGISPDRLAAFYYRRTRARGGGAIDS